MKPIVWTIAGSDSSNGAGLSADLQVFTQLGLHGCAVTTAVTAQNPQSISAVHCMPPEMVAAQLNALETAMPCKVIKIGMLGSVANMHIVQRFLERFKGEVVWDPVMSSTTGHSLMIDDHAQYIKYLTKMLPLVTLFTPNKNEVEILLNRRIHSNDDIEQAARDFIKLGANSVCIKGGHFSAATMCHDFWTDGKTAFWLSAPRYPEKNYRGTGCTFAAASAAALALNYRLEDALVIAKMYVTRGIRLAQHPCHYSALLHHAGLPHEGIDLPYVAAKPILDKPKPFTRCAAPGLYPIVDSVEWVERLCAWGISTLQLRVKQPSDLHQVIEKSIRIAARHHARLYINDHWELALQYGAYGVHLGQEDLLTFDVERLRMSGLRLGISTHSHVEVARAHALYPSYLACGPVYATTSKIMPFAPQGIQQLSYWRNMLANYPWVAIGGINEKNIASVLATDVQGVAMISAITHANHSEQQVKQLLKMVQSSCFLAMTN